MLLIKSVTAFLQPTAHRKALKWCNASPKCNCLSSFPVIPFWHKRSKRAWDSDRRILLDLNQAGESQGEICGHLGIKSPIPPSVLPCHPTLFRDINKVCSTD